MPMQFERVTNKVEAWFFCPMFLHEGWCREKKIWVIVHRKIAECFQACQHGGSDLIG
jgi:hypothetical protein